MYFRRNGLRLRFVYYLNKYPINIILLGSVYICHVKHCKATREMQAVNADSIIFYTIVILHLYNFDYHKVIFHKFLTNPMCKVREMV